MPSSFPIPNLKAISVVVKVNFAVIACKVCSDKICFMSPFNLLS